MATQVASQALGDVDTSLSPIPDRTNSFYQREFLDKAKSRMVHSKYVDTAKMPAKSGKEVIFRRWSYLAQQLSPLAEGVAPTGKKPSNTDYRAALVQYGDFIAMTDFLDATAIDDIQTHWAALLGEQAGYSMDSIERDVMVAGSNAIFANGTQRTDVNTLIDANDLDRATRFLMNNSAETVVGGNASNNTVNSFPTMPAYCAIIAPYTYFDLKNVPDFHDASEYKGAVEGEIGRYKMIAFFTAPDAGNSLGSALGTGAKIVADGGGTASGLVKSTTGTSADVYITLIYGKHFFTKVPFSLLTSSLIRKAAGSAGSLDPLNQISTMGWKNSSSRLRTNENWGTRIEHAVSP